MSPSSEQRPAATPTKILRQGSLPTFVPILVVLSPIVIGRELYNAFQEGERQLRLGVDRSFAVNAKNVVTAQLNELDQIHPMRLGTKYYDVLQHSECTWRSEEHTS